MVNKNITPDEFVIQNTSEGLKTLCSTIQLT